MVASSPPASADRRAATGFVSAAITPGAGTPVTSAATQRRSARSRTTAQRKMRRGIGWSSSLPQRSASSTERRANGSGGNSGRSAIASSSAREISSEPCTCRPSSSSAGTVRPWKPAARTSIGWKPASRFTRR
jgi:hypothetical protein